MTNLTHTRQAGTGDRDDPGLLRRRIAQLEGELAAVKDALETRKLLDRAKGILMEKKKLTEEQSFVLIRRAAMMNRTTIKKVALAIIKRAARL